MSKLSLAVTTTLMTLSLMSVAQAYSVEPPYTVMQVAMIEAGSPERGEICKPPAQPELLAALGLPQQDTQLEQTELACVDE